MGFIFPVYYWCFNCKLNAYSFLSKRGVKEEILAFDARNISPEIRESVEKLLKKNAESFDSKVNSFLLICYSSIHNYKCLFIKIKQYFTSFDRHLKSSEHFNSKIVQKLINHFQYQF